MFGRKTRWSVISIHVFLYSYAVCTNYMFCILKSLRHNKKKSTKIQASLLFLIKKLQFSFSDKEKKIICHFFFFTQTEHMLQLSSSNKFSLPCNLNNHLTVIKTFIMSDTKSLLSFVLLFFLRWLPINHAFLTSLRWQLFIVDFFFIYVMFIRESDDWVTTTP